MKPNRLAALGLVAGLVGGGILGLALGVPVLAGAQTDASTATADASPGPWERTRWMKDALVPLVENGTITQSQSEAVIAALEAARPARGPRGGLFRAGPAKLTIVAEALGITVDELRTALTGGQTIAEVAQSKGVDPEKVVEAIAAEMRTHIQEKVTAGRITQEQADEMLSGLTDRVRAAVNGDGPAFRPGLRPGRHGRGFRFAPPATPDSGADSSSPTA